MINLGDIEEARETIGSLIRRTPLVYSQYFSSLCDGEVYLKLENLQVTNSFKIRGALNKMFHLSTEEMKRGVVTASTGNHAQAIAKGAEELNLPAQIVVPKDTSKVKIDKIREYNVELIFHGDFYDEAEEKAINLAKKNGLTYLSPYNDKMIIAGQGTIGMEILEDLPSVDAVIVPIGGGGLVSGICLAVKGIKSNVRIVGVQSEASPTMYESLKVGRIVDTEMRESIADGLFGGIEKGSITFKIVQKYVDDLLLVKEKTIEKAVFLLWKKEEQVVEGAGAVSVAAIMENTDFFKGQDVVAVISGGNIENELFQNILVSGSDRA